MGSSWSSMTDAVVCMSLIVSDRYLHLGHIRFCALILDFDE